MKSLVHTEELCSRSVPLEHAPGAKSFVCIRGLYAVKLLSEHERKGLHPLATHALNTSTFELSVPSFMGASGNVDFCSTD